MDHNAVPVTIEEIGKLLQHTHAGVHHVDDFIFHINHQVADTLKLAQKIAQKSPKRSLILPFVVGVGVGIYLHRRAKGGSVEFTVRDKSEFESSKEDLKQSATDLKDAVKNSFTKPTDNTQA